MKTGTKILISTIVSLVLLLAVVAAGLNAVFTVTKIRADFVVYSADGAREAEELQKKLDEKFLGKSTTFLKLADVEARVAEYPCFRLESLAKKYPTGVDLKIAERREAYAFPLSQGSYAMLDETGYCLAVSEKNASRFDGQPVIEVRYEQIDYADDGSEQVRPLFPLEAKVGKTASADRYFSELLLLNEVFRTYLAEARASVLSVEVQMRSGSEKNHFFVVNMREGCSFAIGDPANGIADKAGMAMRFYLGIEEYAGADADGKPKGMTDEEKVNGRVTVSENGMTRPRY